MKGTPTWVCLPPNQRRGKAAKMTQPVYSLKKALYGHPDAGTYWEEKCDQHVRHVGFEPVGEEWPSCYVHKTMNLFLVIYVDDFKLSGPIKSLPQGWKLLRKGLSIEPEQRLGKEGVTYLGCKIERTEAKLAGGAVGHRHHVQHGRIRAVLYRALCSAFGGEEYSNLPYSIRP